MLKKTTILILAIVFLAFFTKCNNTETNSGESQKDSTMKTLADNFNKEIDGKTVKLYTLTNKNGVKVEITNYGGKVVSINVPDKDGNLGDIVLGYESIDEYIKGNFYFGALIGRYGNRIAKGKFSLNGEEYQLATNNGENHLHGGIKGFHDVVWEAITLEIDGEQALELSYISIDGEENYPGTLKSKVIYQLTEKNELKITYEAETDKTTVLNLTHHSFFNLAGEGSGTINNHELMINADRFTPVDEGLIPTGELAKVENTPMDFRTGTVIGERVDSDFEQLKFGKGYDHNWVLNKENNEMSLAASVYEPTTGRVMEVWTDQPGLQFYGGNFLDATDIGKGGKAYEFRTAFCLETQHFPDSPNNPNFPTTTLNPGEKYTHTCIYKFSVK